MLSLWLHDDEDPLHVALALRADTTESELKLAPEQELHSGSLMSFLTPASFQLSKWLRIAAPLTSEHWGGSSAAEWSRSMIGQCMHQHSHITENFRPKRPIDIQSRPIKLVKSERLESPGVYATLSYCWGSEIDSQAQLMTDTEEIEAQLSLGFDEQQLTAVVRDAMDVARSLSIPYLWVDALCIRQDKSRASDWEEHAEIMHRIYGNAYVTVAATSSSSCREGFLTLNEPGVYLNYHSTLRHDNTGLLKVTLRPKAEQHPPSNRSDPRLKTEERDGG